MPPVLTLVGTADCHLCHEMRQVVEHLLPDLELALVERDVAEHPELARYRLEIPVLLLDGEELARHRVSEADLRRRLRAAGVRHVASPP